MRGDRVIAAVVLFGVSLVASSATPTLIGTAQLSGTLASGRSSSDGRLLVVELRDSNQQSSRLQVIDTSNVTAPRLLGLVALPKINRLALTSDGTLALAEVQTEKERYNQNTGHEIIAIDLSDATRPREKWRRLVRGRKVVLARDASAFAYSRVSLKNPDGWETIVVLVANPDKQIAVEEDPFTNGNMALAAGASYLVFEWYGELRMWNLATNPPTEVKQDHPLFSRFKSDCFPAVLDSGYVAMEDARTARIGIYQAKVGIPRVSTVKHDGAEHCEPLNPNTVDRRFVYGDPTGRLQELDLRNPSSPAIPRSWQTPQNANALAFAQGILFSSAGKNGTELHLYSVENERKSATDWQALQVAYRTILDTYNAELKAHKPIPGMSAVRRLQEAGVIQALDAQIEGISPQEAAAILNDYGFLATKWAPQHIAERSLRRAIEIDPKRAVAHLNLADFLRQTLAREHDALGDNTGRRTEIELHYRTYLSLGGKHSQSIDNFLKGDPGSANKAELCGTIAAYANLGRLSELVSDVGLRIPYGGRRIDLIFTTEGTAHVPTYYAFDSTNDFRLEDTEVPSGPVGSDDLWGGDSLGLLTYRNEHYILHYKDFTHPVAAIALAGGRGCRFEAVTTERIGQSAIEPELCTELQGGKGPANLIFGSGTRMTGEQVSAKWGESAINGTRTIDFANDGIPVNVAELSLSSGAGAGCDETFYETVDANATQFVSGPKRDLLMKLQKADPSNRYPILPCGNSPRFFAYKKRVYFETKPSSWPPVDTWNQYHRVTTINDGQVKDVCDFRFETKVVSQGATAR